MSDLFSEGAFPEPAENGEVVLETFSEENGHKNSHNNNHNHNHNPSIKVNKQLYQNSGLADSPVAEVLDSLDHVLYGRKDPNLAIHKEKPEHRLVLLYKLRGLSNREIAEQTGYTEPWISQICRQPWFQAYLTKALAETEGEIIDKIVAIEAKNSIFKLVQLRDTAKSESVQAACATEILNRHLGKPVQRQEIHGTYEHTLTKVDQIEKELELVEQEERRLLSLGTA